jgi:hypothetical protein
MSLTFNGRLIWASEDLIVDVENDSGSRDGFDRASPALIAGARVDGLRQKLGLERDFWYGSLQLSGHGFE